MKEAFQKETVFCNMSADHSDWERVRLSANNRKAEQSTAKLLCFVLLNFQPLLGNMLDLGMLRVEVRNIHTETSFSNSSRTIRSKNYYKMLKTVITELCNYLVFVSNSGRQLWLRRKGSQKVMSSIPASHTTMSPCVHVVSEAG
ncbi:hypothetical protein ILYODFUR_032310 [Ilyodon furcidens]|uniref:Uncharacterized protein n=1 Tax=Ilyodon furcidens TaxID=33524 RepID=A0ABV0SRB1_9TELE